VNPRVSRSSALASKATGYPIARVAAKIAIGLHLDEIENAVTKKTKACFEPALDYVVVKFPRWPFDKFVTADRRIGTQMKATGEVMAIDRTFEGALMKAIRSLEIGAMGLTRRGTAALSDMQIEEGLAVATDERIFIVAEAFRRGMMVEEVAQLSNIDPWFLEKIRQLVEMETRLRLHARELRELVQNPCDQHPAAELLRTAKGKGFPDAMLADIAGVDELELRRARKALGIEPVYKMVDTCAAEFEAETPYYYSSYEQGESG